jgi:methylenetetrahydrofolate dehydrogenase (NADP+)/methenyltetrahydrofolate cyclohydrolase
MIHPKTVIIDAGINETAEGTIVGDVAPEAAAVAEAMSPTPGGVGTLTSLIVFENLLKAVKLQMDNVE